MGEKRQVTIVSLTLVLDGQWVSPEFEQLCLQDIRKACSRQGDKYYPEAWVEMMRYQEMEIITK